MGGINMPIVEYNSLNQMYPSGAMSENVKRLKDYDVFHCLLAGGVDRAAAVTKRVPSLPKDFLKWLEVCDGGMLFDTVMLCTKTHDVVLDLDFETYGDYYDTELRTSKGLSKDWFVFAVAIHGDVFFFDMGKRDGQVYQWDVEECKIYVTWQTFEDWLTSIIDEAITLIAEEQLEPLDIKLEVDDNG